MKWKIITTIVIVVVILIVGLLHQNHCSIETPEYCNRECVNDNDCKAICGCGCINQEEHCLGMERIYCIAIPVCQCVDGQCKVVSS